MKYEISKIYEYAIEKVTTTKERPMRMFMQAILAGFFLGGAMILSYTLGALFIDNTAVSKTLISFSFGAGLVAICFLGAELFTGNCFTLMMPVYHKILKLREIMPTLIICYVGNIIGISIICALFIFSQKHNPLYIEFFQNMYETKMNFDISSLFVKAILCNFGVCIATYANIRVHDSFPKLILIFSFVAMFVIAGLEHCIANAGFFAFVLTEFGTSVDLSQIPIHMLISTIGNFIGGGILLGYPIYYIINEQDPIDG